MSRSLAKQIFVRCGAPGVVRALRGSRLRILMYHRFFGQEDLEGALSRQLEHVRRHYQPVSMRQIGEALSGGPPLPVGAVAITVDDGYADFALAWPCFRRFELPVTLFVVSGFIDRITWLWPDVVHFCCQNSSLERLQTALPNGKEFEHPLGTLESRAAADCALDRILIEVPDSDRRAIVASLPASAGVALPDTPPDRYLPLSWSQLGFMAREGLEVGAHTLNHPILAKIEDPERLREEVEGSRDRIGERLGSPVTHFCYPNGQRGDYNAETRRVVGEAGFHTAVNAVPGLNGVGSDPLDLCRVGVDPSTPFPAFQMEVAGYGLA